MPADTSAVTAKELFHLQFLNREHGFRHTRYPDDTMPYRLIMRGDPAAGEEADKLFSAAIHGHLSDDPLRNIQYLFVCSATLATRFACDGGLDGETAYSLSDLYIQKMDRLTTPADIRALHREMIQDFAGQVSAAARQRVYSKPVLEAMAYIDQHLHETIRIADIADAVCLNESYLMTLFREEMGSTVGDYITARRVEAAENMLAFTDMPLAQISSCLSFSSQSYFAQVFRKVTGLTPREYRALRGSTFSV